MSLFQSNGVITDCLFLDNTAQTVNNGITIISSTLNASRILVNFTNPAYLAERIYNVDTGFFNMNYRSSLQVNNSIFANCRGAIAGFLYATGSSSVFLQTGTLIMNTYSVSGPTVYASLGGNIIIDGVTMVGSSVNDVSLE